MHSFLAFIALISAFTHSVAAQEVAGQSLLRNLPADKAILTYDRVDQASLTVTLTKTMGVKQLSLIAPENDIDRLASRLLDSLNPDRVTVASPDDLPAFDARSAHHLFMLLVHPLMDELGGIDRLAITAEGALADLPFDTLLTALPVTELRDAGRYAAFPWLRKRFVISRLARATRPVSSAFNTSRTEGGLLGFGNPTIGQNVGLAVPALPDANLELALLRMSLHGRSGEIAVGAKASEARFKQALTSSEDLAVLAVATHGFRANGAEDDAVLMLSHGDGEDGILTAAEVRALRFRADLVILSACNSGARTLVEAFIEAGGEQVLAMRWPVLSDVARQISTSIVDLTQRDADLPHDLALWRSVDQLINGGTSPHHGHPMVWAPFVLTAAVA